MQRYAPVFIAMAMIAAPALAKPAPAAGQAVSSASETVALATAAKPGRPARRG